MDRPNSKQTCGVCHTATTAIVEVQAETYKYICQGCLDLLQFEVCQKCEKPTYSSLYNYKRKMCSLCFEARQKKKRKKGERKAPKTIDLTALEKRAKRYLIQGRFDKAVPALQLLIEELRICQQFEKADILDMTLNQLQLEHPEYFSE